MKTFGMKTLGLLVVLLAGFAMAAPPAFAADSGGYSAVCKDGSNWTGTSKRGACRGHKGVQSWVSESNASPSAAAGAPASHSRKSQSETTAAASTAAGGEVTATCKDGSTWSGKSKRGACRGHKGVASWSGEGSASATAAGPAAQPASAAAATGGQVTATCKDGSTWSGKSKRGACRGHKGVASWTGEGNNTAASTAAPAAANAGTRATQTGGSMGSPAPGGGPGLVWANPDSKTYHCQGTKWYGTTKHGSYMTEAQATAQGYHADHGKACTK